jgi:UDP-N-acetylglucosamine--N-acetylmuramyl-(pentapeptide) pyrophosphoryl-undecaprenol N-acetylglucosamine transferase
VYIGQKGDPFVEVVAHCEAITKVYEIRAGKLRRYHTEGVKQLLDVRTMLLNIRDVFLVGVGIIQSIALIGRLRPRGVFIKGGFVGVPVGIASALWHKPYVTHDSDAIAGLANKIIARWASVHAVALPKEQYNYPQDKTVTVGVPISAEYKLVDASLQQRYRNELSLQDTTQVIFVTGGGLGAQIINESMVAIAPQLLQKYPKLYIVHSAGRMHATAVQQAYEAAIPDAMQRITVKAYVEDLYQYSGAADVVVTRAGATSMAELATQGKACVIVPNPVLAGGHQLKNAEAFEAASAVKAVYEKDLRANPEVLLQALETLLDNPEQREILGTHLHALAYPDSAKLLAEVVLKVAGREK